MSIRDESRTAATSKMERFVMEAVNYYHKVLHLRFCSSPRPASVYDACCTKFNVYYFILHLFCAINDPTFKLMLLINSGFLLRKHGVYWMACFCASVLCMLHARVFYELSVLTCLEWFRNGVFDIKHLWTVESAEFSKLY